MLEERVFEVSWITRSGGPGGNDYRCPNFIDGLGIISFGQQEDLTDTVSIRVLADVSVLDSLQFLITLEAEEI